jgi:hypothetical protein
MSQEILRRYNMDIVAVVTLVVLFSLVIASYYITRWIYGRFGSAFRDYFSAVIVAFWGLVLIIVSIVFSCLTNMKAVVFLHLLVRASCFGVFL